MTQFHLLEDNGTALSDPLTGDGVAVSAGASIVVAVAATIALVLALLVATLSGATAAPVTHPETLRTLVIAAPSSGGLTITVAETLRPTPATYRITEVLPERDGSFELAPGTGAPDRPTLATPLLALIAFATVTASWTALAAVGLRLRPGRRRAGTRGVPRGVH